MDLRLLQPPFGPERTAEVVVGARLVGVELDRALELLGRRARPAGLVEDRRRGPCAPPTSGARPPPPGEESRPIPRSAAGPPRSDRASGARSGLWGQRLGRAAHVNLGALELPRLSPGPPEVVLHDRRVPVDAFGPPPEGDAVAPDLGLLPAQHAPADQDAHDRHREPRPPRPVSGRRSGPFATPSSRRRPPRWPTRCTRRTCSDRPRPAAGRRAGSPRAARSSRRTRSTP